MFGMGRDIKRTKALEKITHHLQSSLSATGNWEIRSVKGCRAEMSFDGGIGSLYIILSSGQLRWFTIVSTPCLLGSDRNANRTLDEQMSEGRNGRWLHRNGVGFLLFWYSVLPFSNIDRPSDLSFSKETQDIIDMYKLDFVQ